MYYSVYSIVSLNPTQEPQLIHVLLCPQYGLTPKKHSKYMYYSVYSIVSLNPTQEPQ